MGGARLGRRREVGESEAGLDRGPREWRAGETWEAREAMGKERRGQKRETMAGEESETSTYLQVGLSSSTTSNLILASRLSRSASDNRSR